MVRKTREQALATRSAILDAAEIVFQERGVSNTRYRGRRRRRRHSRRRLLAFRQQGRPVRRHGPAVFGLMEAKLEELQTTRHYDDPVELLRELALHFLDRVANDPRYYRIIGISWHKCEYVGEMVEIRDQHFERGNCFLRRQ